MTLKNKLSVFGILALFLIFTGFGTLGVYWAIDAGPDTGKAAAMTNVATVGGIVSGLSLSGTAVFSITGSYQKYVLPKYGGLIRLFLFGGFSFVAFASLASGIGVIWESSDWTTWLLSFAVSLTSFTLLFTALIINAAFLWAQEDIDKRDDVLNEPYVNEIPKDTHGALPNSDPKNP